MQANSGAEISAFIKSTSGARGPMSDGGQTESSGQGDSQEKSGQGQK